MLYLEDFLELIEQLPAELREQFTDMREMDLTVQNSIDDLDIRVKQFFMNCRKAKPEWKDLQYKQIKDEYEKALEDAEEKVTIATQIYDLVDKHLRKLDQELSKFKMELEADNAGITEVLEQRSLRLDEPVNSPLPMTNHISLASQNSSLGLQKRKYSQIDVLTNDIPNGEHSLAMPRHDSYSSYSPVSAYSQLSPSPKSSAPQATSPSLSYTIGTVGPVGAAGVQAMSNSLQMQQNRRVGNTLKAPYGSSYKASSDYLGGLSSGTPGSLNGLPPSNYDTPPSAVTASLSIPITPVDSSSQLTVPTATTQRKNKKNKSMSSQLATTATASAQVEAQEAAKAAAAVPDWVYDPNEPRYCLCNQVSYGEMVGCDNDNCKTEWFHYGCVGLTDAPKGKWYCPNCIGLMKQKRSRHK